MIKIKMVKGYGDRLYGANGKFLLPTVEITVGRFFHRFHGIAVIAGKLARQNKAGYFKYIRGGEYCFPGTMQ